MSYTGKVTEGGPADVRELSRLMITKMVVGDFGNNTYLLRCRQTDEQVLVDAAAEPEPDPLPRRRRRSGQGRHHPSARRPLGRAGRGGRGDRRDDVRRHARRRGHPGADRRPGRGRRHRSRSATCTLTAIHLVGHTPGSIALLYDDPDGTPHLFTGDCLFPGGVGNTFGSKENFDALLHDVTTKLFDRLPDETWFYPGHGDDSRARRGAAEDPGVARARLVGTHRASEPVTRSRGRRRAERGPVLSMGMRTEGPSLKAPGAGCAALPSLPPPSHPAGAPPRAGRRPRRVPEGHRAEQRGVAGAAADPRRARHRRAPGRPGHLAGPRRSGSGRVLRPLGPAKLRVGLLHRPAGGPTPTPRPRAAPAAPPGRGARRRSC